MEEETQKPISAKSTADLRVVEAADSHFYGRRFLWSLVDPK
jgi:hypothetical protein